MIAKQFTTFAVVVSFTIMNITQDSKPQTTIRPRSLATAASLGVTGFLLLLCLTFRRDIITDFGQPVWWVGSFLLSGIAGVLCHRLLFPRPLLIVTPTHLIFPATIAKPIKWSRIQRIEVVADRAGLRDVRDRLILHFKKPTSIAWRSKKMRARIGDLKQHSLSIDIDHAWPCRANDVRRILRNAATNFASAPSQSSPVSKYQTHRPALALIGMITILSLLPVLSHATGFGLPRVFSKGLGYYQTGDIKNALPYLQEDARAGDPEASLALGMLYLNGDGVDRNLAMALGWFQRAARQGSALAAYQLGNAHRLGLGTPIDVEQAIAWYSRAANDGVPEAATALAQIYRLGDGVRRDYAMAIRWLKVAASDAHAPALHDLGMLHLDGIGVPQDTAVARTYLERAARDGHIPARYDLALLLLGGSKSEQAEGAEMLLAVADAGFGPAQRDLAKRLYAGKGFERSLIDAYKWLILAERSWPEAGREDVQRERLGVGRSLTPEQLDAAKSRVRGWKPAAL